MYTIVHQFKTARLKWERGSRQRLSIGKLIAGNIWDLGIRWGMYSVQYVLVYICMYTGVKWDRITIISSISKGLETYSTDRMCIFQSYELQHYNSYNIHIYSINSLAAVRSVPTFLSLRYCLCFLIPTVLSLLSYPYGTAPAPSYPCLCCPYCTYLLLLSLLTLPLIFLLSAPSFITPTVSVIIILPVPFLLSLH